MRISICIFMKWERNLFSVLLWSIAWWREQDMIILQIHSNRRNMTASVINLLEIHLFTCSILDALYFITNEKETKVTIYTVMRIASSLLSQDSSIITINYEDVSSRLILKKNEWLRGLWVTESDKKIRSPSIIRE